MARPAESRRVSKVLNQDAEEGGKPTTVTAQWLLDITEEARSSYLRLNHAIPSPMSSPVQNHLEQRVP